MIFRTRKDVDGRDLGSYDAVDSIGDNREQSPGSRDRLSGVTPSESQRPGVVGALCC
jgi:hypothetical protein